MYNSFLYKSASKSNLVQVMRTITKNGKTFQQHFWVKPSEVKPTDSVIGSQPNNASSSAVGDNKQSNPKQMIVQLLQKGHSKQDLISKAKQLGIHVNESQNEGINWMRYSMAIQKDMSKNPSNWSDSGSSQTVSQTAAKPSNDSNTQPSQTSNKTNDTKKQVSELRDKYGVDKLIQMAKSAGISWKENDNSGINWMRCSMAISKELSKNPDLLNGFGSVGVDNLMRMSTKSQLKPKSTVDPVLKGLTMDSKSSYEKDNFGQILDKSTPESFRTYRTLGMCAGDSEAEQYLSRLYKDYSTTVQSMGTTPVATVYDPNIDKDSLRNSLQGVVNKMIVGVVKSSMSNVKKRTQQFTLQQKLFEPWVNPNHSLTSSDKDELKSFSGVNRATAKQHMMMEKDGKHEMMKRVIDRMSTTPEYGDIAKEYKSILTEFENLTQGIPFLQTIATQPTTSQSALFTLHNHMMEEVIRRDNYKKEIDAYVAAGTGIPEYLQKNYDSSVIKASEAEQLYAQFSTPSKLDSLVEASKLKPKLFDKKFECINVNLWAFKQIGGQLAFQYDITRDFISEFPILSKSDIDKLDSGDQTALTNLSLHAGMFKPSLSKGNSDAKSAIMQKFKERQDFIETYGGISTIKDNSGYAEDNEVKCKVSSVSQKVYDEICKNIAKDWDMKNHGQMKYRIKGVYEVSGLQLEEKFNSIKKSHSGTQTKSSKVTGHTKNQSSDLFYHGTGAMATSLILGHSGAFKVGKAKVGRMLGDGIYLADKASKSAQYISDEGYSRKGIHGSLMVVEASIGTVTSRGDRHNWDKYDTVFAGTQKDHVLNNEWCVHNPDAVIPRYLVEMEVL